jgi:hypothetical protein
LRRVTCGINLVGFDLGMRDHANLFRVRNDNPTDMRCQHFGNRRRIASRFHDDDVVLR